MEMPIQVQGACRRPNQFPHNIKIKNIKYTQATAK